jgi:hypothetical protein
MKFNSMGLYNRKPSQAEVHIVSDLTFLLGANDRLRWPAQRIAIFFVHLDPHHFPDDLVDIGILYLVLMNQVCFNLSWLTLSGDDEYVYGAF